VGWFVPLRASGWYLKPSRGGAGIAPAICHLSVEATSKRLSLSTSPSTSRSSPGGSLLICGGLSSAR